MPGEHALCSLKNTVVWPSRERWGRAPSIAKFVGVIVCASWGSDVAHAGMESQSAGLEEVSEPVDFYPRGRASRELVE